MPKHRILVVEDEAIIAADIERRLTDLGYEVAGVSSTGMDACEKAAALLPDLVLMDIVLRGELSGIDAARWIRDRQGIPVVYLTSHADTATVDAACATEPHAYLLKPLNERELRVTLQVVFEKQKADARARRIEHWLAATLHSIGDAIITTDREGRITFLNTHAEEITGWSLEAAVFHPLGEVYPVVDHDNGARMPDPALAAIEQQATVSFGARLALLPRRGGRIFIEQSAAPIRDFHGQTCGAVIVFRDSTRAMLSELEIVQLKERLEQTVADRTAELVAANRELELFTAFASHDLRRPLQNIYAHAFLLGSQSDVPLSEDSLGLIEKIQNATLVMGSMLDAFLKLAHAGRKDLERRPVPMRALVDQTIRELDLRSSTPGLDLRLGQLETVEGDAVLLRQVWTNLLTNAVKFAQEDRPLRLEVGSRTEEGRLVFFVKDNGIGFSMQEAPHLFHAFQRLESSAGHSGGHGLGLALVRRIVQRHGGTVWAESRPGEGATFFFSIATPVSARAGAEPATL